jgi:hypothetical protein
MTVAELITRCLEAIRVQFYSTASPRDFPRDSRALTKAISRYGYACNERGWQFEPHVICRDILAILPRIEPPRHQWLPLYLETCIDRHVGMRAEELAAKSKNARAVPLLVSKKADELTPAVIIEKSGTEILALLHRELSTINHQKKRLAKAARQGPVPVQPSLF